MPVELLGLHRLEGAGADVQRDVGLRHAALRECVEHRSIEMQTRGRRCDCAAHARIHGLVAFGVGGVRRVRDVGRKRQFAVLLEPAMQLCDPFESQAEEAAVARFDGCARPGREIDAATDAWRMACLQLHDRRVGSRDPLDQHLDLAAGGLAPMDARIDDTRVVEHHEVARIEQRGQIGEAQVAELSCVDVQQTARAALARGRLRDQLLWQRIVEIGEGVGLG